jgi:protein-S-isoprenylcysteine O-methyltransferase Ste14
MDTGTIDSKVKSGEHPWGDRGQVILLVVFLAVWVLDSYVVRFSTGLSHIVPLAVRLAAAAAVLAVSVLLMRSAHAYLEHGALNTGVVSSGAFRYVRHPLYLGSMLFYLALAIATVSLLSLLVFLVIVVFYDYIARYEERLLETKYGDGYRAYLRVTGRWIPRPGR